VHTDDIAWGHSRFGWTDLAQYVLETARTGEALSFRPPAWIERGREGAIVVPSSIQVLLLEGVGSSREELAHLLDARLWVQADWTVIERRNAVRVAAGETTSTGVAGLMAEELPFVAARRLSSSAWRSSLALHSTERPRSYKRRWQRSPPMPGVGAATAFTTRGRKRPRLPRLQRSQTIPKVDDAPVWSVLCFNVRPGFRRRGVAVAPLEGVVDYARRSGAPGVEAIRSTPRAAGSTSHSVTSA